MIVFLLLLAVLGCCLWLILYGRKNYGILEKCGILIVKPSWFLGSVPDFHNKVHQLEDIKRFNKYGSIWGVYEGQDPQVHIADPELIRLIFVKDFDYFHDRRSMDFGSNVFNEILDYLPGKKWKTVRQMLTPILTTSKLKFMSPTIAVSAEEFATDLSAECVNDMFTRATLGVQMKNAKNPSNDFAVAFRTFMGEGTTYNWIYSMSLTFPFLTTFAPTFDNGPTNLIEKTFRHILQARRESGEKKHSDLVDVLNELIDRTSSEEYKKLKISEDTIISQAVNTFLGGYETSGSTSTVLLYYLAMNPIVQTSLQSEIDGIFEKSNGEINHDTIRDEQTPYLTTCINEALRLGPLLYRPERVCTKDWTYQNIKIKRSTTVFLCNWAMHRDPLHFVDREIFMPERFLPGNKDKINPYAFVPFGLGPRACIGVRFAYESLKFLFIHLLRNFNVESRTDTNLEYKPGQQIVVAFKPLYLDLVKRKQ